MLYCIYAARETCTCMYNKGVLIVQIQVHVLINENIIFLDSPVDSQCVPRHEMNYVDNISKGGMK